MRFVTVFFLPYVAVFIATKRRRRAYLWSSLATVAIVQLFSLLPVGAIVYSLYMVSEVDPQAASLGKLYNDYRVTQAGLHGLTGWQGVDVSGGCGYPIYAPFGGAITYNGLDGYNHVDERGVVHDQNTMLTLKGDNGMTLTLLHGDYRQIELGAVVENGDLLGYESSIGWSTGCHSHVILKDANGRTLNFLDWQVASMDKQEKPLKISWYDPALGGINCDSDCSTMASGARVTSERYGNTAACIREWMGKTVVIEGVGRFTCMDTGGAIVEHPGFIWIDLMLREPIVPFGTLVYEWELIER